MGDIWQGLGIGGDALGTNGTLRRTFFYSFIVAAAVVGAVNTLNVLTILQDEPQLGLAGPVIWESTSWLSLMLFLPLPWAAWRIAPPSVKPRWWLMIHIPAAMLYSLAHVSVFVALRSLAYWLAGQRYDYGSFWPHFLYESRKDALGYALFVAGFTLVHHLLRQQQLIATPGQTLTFDIRDGARLTRVPLDEVLAIASAGNYVEFVLRDGRKLLMRSSLSALESELGPRGFLRTHRSWLVNASRVTGLKPEGSGDYAVAVDGLEIPLSRRFPETLRRLRGA